VPTDEHDGRPEHEYVEPYVLEPVSWRVPAVVAGPGKVDDVQMAQVRV
jgi:hypothetical protein